MQLPGYSVRKEGGWIVEEVIDGRVTTRFASRSEAVATKVCEEMKRASRIGGFARDKATEANHMLSIVEPILRERLEQRAGAV